MGYSKTSSQLQGPWSSASLPSHGCPPSQQEEERAPADSTSGNNVVDSTEFVSVDDEKTMEEASTATAPTQNTDLFGEAHADEDDTTTIRSLDSITGRGLVNLTEEGEEVEAQDYASTVVGGGPAGRVPASAEVASTCSVSTAPSTADEASSAWDSYSQDRLKSQYQQQHHRVPSWEVSPHSQYLQQQMQGDRGSPAAVNLPPAYSPSGWSQQPHVASFRQQQQQQQPPPPPQSYMGRTNPSGQQWRHQSPGRYGHNDPTLPFLPPTLGRVGPNNYPYQIQQRKTYSQPPLPPSSVTSTPTRERGAGRGHHRVLSSGQSSHRSQQQGQQQSGGGGSARSSSEILKTLLRKKACLYEPDTSRAVALVTWLVGRQLALQYGFFSRQQLQAGVHACVANKIDSGIITRTKVNRCMQIILNSCFHYIIPRPDGTEENGESFRGVFAREMSDDSFLLSVLPAPWDDIEVNSSEILTASQEEMDSKSPKKSVFETPTSSPRLVAIADKGSPGKDSTDGDGSEAKRAVLLCFNENVRCAEDVFRCHNEFIRDTAHACSLQLSSNEWRLFFGKEAASAPYLWGNVGIPVPYLEGQGPSQTDALGVLTKEEVGTFRTSWCCKRYDHDHELCGFAHPEVNGGWLRRNPSIQAYKDQMCQYIQPSSTISRSGSKNVIINECPYGISCEFAHSVEEIIYHPFCYKQKTCASTGRAGGCHLADVCPNFHAADSYRFPKKPDGRSPRHSKQSQQHGASGGKGASSTVASPPKGSPMLYVSPAPISSFERQLLMPGLQNLYRRHCSIVRKNVRTGNDCTCTYSCFGDDVGIHQQQKQQSIDRSKTIGPPQPTGKRT